VVLKENREVRLKEREKRCFGERREKMRERSGSHLRERDFRDSFSLGKRN